MLVVSSEKCELSNMASQYQKLHAACGKYGCPSSWQGQAGWMGRGGACKGRLQVGRGFCCQRLCCRCLDAVAGSRLQVFKHTKAAAALAAGIFHRQEVAISEVKEHMNDTGIPARVA